MNTATDVLVVGAGFASGQEAMLYFSAFGTQGLWGAVLGSVLMLIAGVTILQLGSFFQAKEHMEVLGSISSKVMGWILDIAGASVGTPGAQIALHDGAIATAIVVAERSSAPRSL